MGKARSSKRAARKARVLIVDDHPVVRQGLGQLIDQTPDLEVCAEAADPAEALKAIRATRPDVAIVDLSLREGSGLELIKDIKIRHAKLPTLVLSMLDETVYAERSLRAGARGYVSKSQATDLLMTAIRRVLRGDVYLSEKMAARMLNRLAEGKADEDESSMGLLSDRELEVFDMIGQGLRSREIAQRLSLSVKTIETYRENIKRKLGLRDASDLLQSAIRWGREAGA